MRQSSLYIWQYLSLWVSNFLHMVFQVGLSNCSTKGLKNSKFELILIFSFSFASHATLWFCSTTPCSFCIFHSHCILLLCTKYISLVKLKIKQQTTFWKYCNSRQDQLLPFYLTTHPILWFTCGDFCFFFLSIFLQ